MQKQHWSHTQASMKYPSLILPLILRVCEVPCAMKSIVLTSWNVRRRFDFLCPGQNVGLHTKNWALFFFAFSQTYASSCYFSHWVIDTIERGINRVTLSFVSHSYCMPANGVQIQYRTMRKLIWVRSILVSCISGNPACDVPQSRWGKFTKLGQNKHMQPWQVLDFQYVAGKA